MSISSSNTRVILFGENQDNMNVFITIKKLGSSYLFGEVLSEYIPNSICIDDKEIKNKIKDIKNSNIFLIKKPIGTSYNPNHIYELRKNNNKIIYFIVDAYSVMKNEFLYLLKNYSNLYDLVLANNMNIIKDIKNIANNTNILLHPYDPRILKNNSRHFNICYFGIMRKDKILFDNNVSWVDCTVKNKTKMYKLLSNFSCHYSVRGENWTEYIYGVNTKLSCAAASNSNIICSRDKSFTEILPKYDYYIDNIEPTTIINMMQKCKRDFGSASWNKNLNRLEPIKKKTHPKKIANDLSKLVPLS